MADTPVSLCVRIQHRTQRETGEGHLLRVRVPPSAPLFSNSTPHYHDLFTVSIHGIGSRPELLKRGTPGGSPCCGGWETSFRLVGE